jgi:nucleoside-diphosphate-sugar epimerase
MRVLVTGGAGFIGSHTVDALLEKGHEVRILDNLQKPVHLKGKPGWVPDEAEFILGDVRDKAMWERCLDGVDAVYHFAAYQDYLPDFSTFFHVNAVGTALLYEVAVEKKIDLAKVVVASSQFVQGEGIYACPACRGQKSEVRERQRSEDRGQRSEGQEKDEHRTSNIEHRTSNEKMKQRAEGRGRRTEVGGQTSEVGDQRGIFGGVIRFEAQLKRGRWEMLCPACGEAGEWLWTPESYVSPPNAYAMAKYSQELQALTFGRRYGIPSVALRYSIVHGPRQSFYNAYSGACRIFSLNYYFGKAPTVYEDGLQCRDFVNIHDVVQANIMALEDERMDYEIFNVGGGKAYTVLEFAEIVREEVEKVREDRGRRSEVSRLRKATPCQGSQKSEKLPDPKVPGLYRFGDTRNACSDISKIRALGWEPRYTPKESVTEYVEWLYEQDNVEDILEYAEKTMKEMDVVRTVRG